MYEWMTGPLEPLGRDALALILDTAVKSSLLLLAAFAFAHAARRRSAAHRHLLWTLAIGLTLAMPLLSRVAPALEVPVGFGLADRSDPAPAAALAPAPAGAPVLREGPRAGPPTGLSPAPAVPETAPEPPSATPLPNPIAPTPPASSRSSSGVIAGGGGPDRSGSFPVIALLGLWAVACTAVLGHLLLGMARLSWLARRSRRITSGALADETRRAAGRLGLARVPVLLEGDPDAIPMTWGLRRSYLLIPAGAESWAGWSRDAILLHELGHIRRRDYLWQVVAQVACAFQWFNPLVWLAAHRMRIEREHACDDLVVGAGHEAARYADELVRLARAFRPGGRAEAAALAFARPNRFRERLIALLDQTRSRRPVSPRRVALVGSIGLAIGVGLASLTPTEAQTAEPSGEAAHPMASPDSDGLVETLSPRTDRTSAGSGRADVVLRQASPTSAEAEPAPVELPRVLPAQEAMVLCGPADGESRRRASLTDDGVRTIEAEYGDCRSSVRIEGDIEFNRDFSAIARMSSGSLMRFELERGGTDRRLEARPGSGGRPEYRWRIDGRDQPFDATAEAWLAAALLDLFRSSSYMARERAAWILDQEGPDGLLAEVELMLADHAQSTYLSILLEQGDLSAAQVRRVITLAGREIDSDHSLGQVLMAAADRYPFDASTRTAFLEAAVSIESDHTQGQIFQRALARDDLSSSDLDLLLETAAGSIESDHTLGEVLMALATRYALEPELRDPFLRAATTIDSDHTAGEVYRTLLGQSGLRSGELAAILDASTEIDSDHTLGELLRTAAAGHDLSDATLRSAFLRAAATIQSDHTRAMVFREAMGLGLDDAEMSAILDAAGEIGSDHELASLLMETAERGLAGATLQRAYLRAAARIGSDHSLSEALRAFTRMDRVGEAEQIELLRTARGIGSDHALAELLVDVAEQLDPSGAALDAFMETLDEIGSRHSRERVEAALGRR